jgi:uncharacterized protein with PIN domain
MIGKDYLSWKYARNYQISHNKCYRCNAELVHSIQTVTIGKQTIENDKVLTCPNCSKINNES